MLDNNLYLHPSLSSGGHHEDRPNRLDHLGNGKGSTGALLCVYMLAFAAESCCQPQLGLPLHQWRGIWRLGILLICAGRCWWRLVEV